MATHQCSFCNKSFSSNKEWEKHEEVCVKNRKTPQERHKARQYLIKQHNKK
jgi:hypothetical protein